MGIHVTTIQEDLASGRRRDLGLLDPVLRRMDVHDPGECSAE